MLDKSYVHEVLEETCGKYIAITDELVAEVTDKFNEFLAMPRGLTPRAPVQTEQKCPACNGTGVGMFKNGVQWKCTVCKGTGISTRSVGG